MAAFNQLTALSMAIESDDPTIQLSSIAADHFDSDHLAVSLPTEIIREILIKLPVKFLLQFRCVCRSWRAMISDPIFVMNHLRASTEEKDYAHHRLITNSVDVELCSLSSVLHEESPIVTHALDYPMKHTHPHPHPHPHPHDWVCLVDSLNGLVCIVIAHSFVFLWNPSTKISKRLPHSGITQHPSQEIIYGFGYNESSSDYKVVAIYTKTIFPQRPFVTEVMIYWLKSDSWKMVEDYPNFSPISTCGIFVSGSLHWYSDIGMGFNDNQSIISLDLSKETFSEISPPCSEHGLMESLIGVLSGCLTMLCNFQLIEVDVWVMKEYGKIDTWCKLFALSSLHGPMYSYCNTPMFISKKNEVFLVFGPYLVVYNVESKTVRHSYIDKFTYVREAFTYVESLVAPFPE